MPAGAVTGRIATIALLIVAVENGCLYGQRTEHAGAAQLVIGGGALGIEARIGSGGAELRAEPLKDGREARATRHAGMEAGAFLGTPFEPALPVERGGVGDRIAVDAGRASSTRAANAPRAFVCGWMPDSPGCAVTPPATARPSRVSSVSVNASAEVRPVRAGSGLKVSRRLQS